MPATALDSIIFRDIFSTPQMRAVFSDENRTACYLEIEAALARVQGQLGIIPQDFQENPGVARESWKRGTPWKWWRIPIFQ